MITTELGNECDDGPNFDKHDHNLNEVSKIVIECSQGDLKNGSDLQKRVIEMALTKNVKDNGKGETVYTKYDKKLEETSQYPK